MKLPKQIFEASAKISPQNGVLRYFGVLVHEQYVGGAHDPVFMSMVERDTEPTVVIMPMRMHGK